MGPISHYYYAFTENVFFFLKSDYSKHVFAQLLLNFIFMVGILLIIYKSVEKKWYTLLFFISIITALIPIGAKAFYEIWGPYVILLPTLLFILSAAKFALGKIKYSIPLVISSIFMFHNHIGTSILVITIIPISLVVYFINQKKTLYSYNKRFMYFLICFTLIIITSLPILYEEIIRENGNLTKIFNFYVKRNSSFSQTFADSITYAFSYFTYPFTSESLGGAIFLVVGSIIGLSIVNFKGKNKAIKYIVVFNLITLLLSILSSMKIIGKMIRHYLWWQYMVVATFYFTASVGLVCLFTIITSKIKHKFKFKLKKLTFSFKTVIAIFIISLTVVYSLKFYSMYEKPNNAVISNIVKKLKLNKNTTYRLNSIATKLNKPLMAGLALKLIKRGYKICVPKYHVNIYGQNLSCSNYQNVESLIIFSKKLSRKNYKLVYNFPSFFIGVGLNNNELINKVVS